MTTAPPVVVNGGAAVACAGRAVRARERALLAWQALADCRFCAHDCGVDRTRGGQGICRAGAETRVVTCQLNMADELELVPTLAIVFSGCDLRCAFCITGAPSWNPRAGQLVAPAALAARAQAALTAGAKSIMFLGGEATIHLHYLLEVVGQLPDTARLVFKTNGHGAEISRRLLHGLFEVWCVDYKFGNDACADRLAQVPDYTRVLRENLVWAAGQGDLIVRHVIMPGHVECCWRPVAEWLAAELPGVKVNLRSGFWPAWQARRHAELRGTVTAAEVREARAIAAACALRLVV